MAKCKRLRAGYYQLTLPDGRIHEIENITGDVELNKGERARWIIRNEKGECYDAAGTLRDALEMIESNGRELRSD